MPDPNISHFVVASGAHNPDKATSMYSFQGVFFTFKSDFGANLEYLLSPTNQSVNPTDLKTVSLVELFMTFSFPQHTLYFECARVLTISCAKLTSALRHTVVSATFSGKYNKNQ